MLTQKEIAKFLGVGQQRVSQLVADGCPRTSIEAVEGWRKERGQKRAPTNAPICKFADEPLPKGRPQKKREPAKTGDSLIDALKNTIAVADGAFEDYEHARIKPLFRLRSESSATPMEHCSQFFFWEC
jgi:hypothetical protein